MASIASEYLKDVIEKLQDEYPSNIVRVVRCKDCKYRGDDICPMYFEEFREWDDDGYLEHDIDVYDYSKDDGYCYMGKRRTDGEEVH